MLVGYLLPDLECLRGACCRRPRVIDGDHRSYALLVLPLDADHHRHQRARRCGSGDRGFDMCGVMILTAYDQHLLYPSGDIQTAIGNETQVAGTKVTAIVGMTDAAVELSLIGGLRKQVATGDRRRLYPYFADLIWSAQRLAFRTDDTQLHILVDGAAIEHCHTRLARPCRHALAFVQGVGI
nr:hypothetical protein [Xanthomonas albilineans]